MDEPRRRTRNIADKKARILTAAQNLFTEKGYSQTTVKAIAIRAGVAEGLVFKHFDTKLKLFEAALIAAIQRAPVNRDSPKAEFSARVAAAIYGDTAIFSPAMIILSIEDEEARRVTVDVLREHVLAPTIDWLGEPHARERAIYLTVLNLSLTLFDRLFDKDSKAGIDWLPVKWVVQSIQDAVSLTFPQSLPLPKPPP